MPARIVATPLGALTVAVAGGAVTALRWGDPHRADEDPLLDRAARQLAEYFAGGLTAFDLPLAPGGSPHDRKVWRAMAEIPCGATESYGALARRVGAGARSVGGACARNPIPVIVPCHRVVGAGGALGGYSGRGGTETKRRLLDHERSFKNSFAQTASEPSGSLPLDGFRA